MCASLVSPQQCVDVKVSVCSWQSWRVLMCACLSLCVICLSLLAARRIKDMDLIKRYRACGEVSGWVLWLVGSGRLPGCCVWRWRGWWWWWWGATLIGMPLIPLQPTPGGCCAQRSFSLQASTSSDRVKDSTQGHGFTLNPRGLVLSISPTFSHGLMGCLLPVLFLNLFECFIKGHIQFPSQWQPLSLHIKLHQ